MGNANKPIKPNNIVNNNVTKPYNIVNNNVTKPNNIVIIKLDEHFKKQSHNKSYERGDAKYYSTLHDPSENYTNSKHFELEKLNNASWCKIDKNRSHDTSMSIFYDTVLKCFAHHLPFILTPDSIRYLILSGLSIIINNDPKTYEKYFFENIGKKNITLKRNEFSDDKENNWAGLVNEFVENINELTINKKLVQCTTVNYSTTSTINSIINKIVLMDSLKSFIDYGFETMCGIPEIELRGTEEDWIKIKELLLCIQKCGLEWWTTELILIIDNVIKATNPNNKIDSEFWLSLVKYQSQSGGDRMTGHLAKFIPLNKDGEKIQWTDGKYDFHCGIKIDDVAQDLSEVPVKWNYLGTTKNLLFVGGNCSAYVTNDGRFGVGQVFAIKEKSIETIESQKIDEMLKDIKTKKIYN